MALTDTEVVNLALDYLGKQNITSLTENTNEAIRSLRQLPIARRVVLTQSPWTFARRVEPLAQEAVNRFEGEWTFCYDLPRDCVKVFRLIPQGEAPRLIGRPVPMYQEGGKLFTHEPDARLLYVFDQTNPDTWTHDFTDAVALQLALRLAPGMVRRSSDVELLRNLYGIAVENAIQNDAGQEVTQYRWGDGYADARMGGPRDRSGPQADGSTIWG